MESLRGQLLIASPSLVDPNFHRTVVLIGEHGDEGAMGVVLNRSSGVTVDEAVPLLAALVEEEAVVHVGGPVQSDAVLVLGEFEQPERAGVLVFGAIGFLPAELVDADAAGPLLRARVFAGYAGWAPGQLEEELAEDAWIVEPARPSDVFAGRPEELWSAVLRRKGGQFRLLATMPADPSLN